MYRITYPSCVIPWYFFSVDGKRKVGRETDDNKGTGDVICGQEEETGRGYGLCFITSFYYR